MPTKPSVFLRKARHKKTRTPSPTSGTENPWYHPNCALKKAATLFCRYRRLTPLPFTAVCPFRVPHCGRSGLMSPAKGFSPPAFSLHAKTHHLPRTTKYDDEPPKPGVSSFSPFHFEKALSLFSHNTSAEAPSCTVHYNFLRQHCQGVRESSTARFDWHRSKEAAVVLLSPITGEERMLPIVFSLVLQTSSDCFRLKQRRNDTMKAIPLLMILLFVYSCRPSTPKN